MVTEDAARLPTRRREGQARRTTTRSGSTRPTRPPVNGNDGGVYESWDRAGDWNTRQPAGDAVLQAALDNDLPFTTCTRHGRTNTPRADDADLVRGRIANSDWFSTLGGDGFKPAVDPTDPNIVYSQYQHRELFPSTGRPARRIDVQPRPAEEDPCAGTGLAPDHHRTRTPGSTSRRSALPSDDRATAGADQRRPDAADRPQPAPGDGAVYGIDAVAKNNSTSFYGNIVALAESPRRRAALRRTDDGLVQVTDDAGTSWRKIESFPGSRTGATSRTSRPRPSTPTPSSPPSTTTRWATSSPTC